uniref:Uncharacterized protein n=1 Tax=Arundo donax TaxID=35708 RepID=A0A0A9A8W7_ARUDO
MIHVLLKANNRQTENVASYFGWQKLFSDFLRQES